MKHNSSRHFRLQCDQALRVGSGNHRRPCAKGAITSKIKHATKLKTSPARLAQVQCAVIGCKLKQNANEGCNSCASLAGLVLSFVACFILLVIAP